MTTVQIQLGTIGDKLKQAVRFTVKCTQTSSKRMEKNCPRDNPRLDSRHAIVGKINIRISHT